MFSPENHFDPSFLDTEKRKRPKASVNCWKFQPWVTILHLSEQIAIISKPELPEIVGGFPYGQSVRGEHQTTVVFWWHQEGFPYCSQKNWGFPTRREGKLARICPEFLRRKFLCYPKDRKDPPMEGWKNLYSRVKVLKIASFEVPMILRVQPKCLPKTLRIYSFEDPQQKMQLPQFPVDLLCWLLQKKTKYAQMVAKNGGKESHGYRLPQKKSHH